jgi:hypothetical protein
VVSGVSFFALKEISHIAVTPNARAHNGTHALRSQVGLGSGGFQIAGVAIQTYNQYFVVILYQSVRCILGSIISDVFRPHIIKIQNRLDTPGAEREWPLLLAQSFCTVFAFVSSVSDLFIFLSRLDLSILSLLVTIVADWACTAAVMAQHRADAAESAAVAAAERRYADKLSAEDVSDRNDSRRNRALAANYGFGLGRAPRWGTVRI